MIVVILGHIFWVLFKRSLHAFRSHISSLATANKLTGSGIKSSSAVAAGPSLGASLQSLHLLLIDFLSPQGSCCQPSPFSSTPLISSLLSTHWVAGDRESLPGSLPTAPRSPATLPLSLWGLHPQEPLRAFLSFTPFLSISCLLFPSPRKELKSPSTYRSPTIFPLKLIPFFFHDWQIFNFFPYNFVILW